MQKFFDALVARHARVLVLGTITIALGALMPTRLAAQAVYTTCEGVDGAACDTDLIHATSSASVSATDGGFPGSNLSATGQATASQQGLGAWATAELSASGVGSIPYGLAINANYYGANSGAVSLDDIVITCVLSSGCASTVSGALNLQTTGTALTTASTTPTSTSGTSNPPADSAYAGDGVTVSGALGGNSFNTTFSESEHEQVTNQGLLGPFDTSSVSSANITQIIPGGTQELTTSYFTLPVGTPIDLSLLLSVNAGVSVGGNGGFGWPVDLNAVADMDYYSTLSFPTSGPVFDLPDAYTVTSAEAGIFDNSYGAPAPVQTPEPSSLLLLGSGLLGLVSMTFRRRRLA